MAKKVPYNRVKPVEPGSNSEMKLRGHVAGKVHGRAPKPGVLDLHCLSLACVCVCGYARALAFEGGRITVFGD